MKVRIDIIINNLSTILVFAIFYLYILTPHKTYYETNYSESEENYQLNVSK